MANVHEYLCEVGVVELVKEWISRRRHWIATGFIARNNYIGPSGILNPLEPNASTQLILEEWGFALERVIGEEYDAEEEENWSLFGEFLSNDPISMDSPHELSGILNKWNNYSVLLFPFIPSYLPCFDDSLLDIRRCVQALLFHSVLLLVQYKLCC